MHADYDKLVPTLKGMLPAVTLGVIGRVVAFIQRLRELRADVFVWAVVLSRFSPGRPAFEEARRWYDRLAGKLIAPRPFHKRFKSEAVVELFARTFDVAVAKWRDHSTPRPRHPIAKCFPDVVLWDSTVMQLSDELKDVFPGLRGIAAGLKVSLAVSLYGLVPLFAEMVAATRNDMLLFPDVSLFKAGTLLLFDLGFVAFDRLRQIAAANLNYVCRLRSDGNPVIVAAPRAPAYVRRKLEKHPEGIKLRDVLPHQKRIRKTWDLDVLLRPDEDRSNPVKARLVITVGPDRIQRPYLTNLDRRLWTDMAAKELYRLRWQVELVFKELKQNLNLESLPTKDQYAVLALAWASLIALALSRAVASCFCPVRNLIGLQAALRPALLTRTLRACIPILGRALVAPPSEVAELTCFLVQYILDGARATHRERDDSLRRLTALLPTNGLA